MWKSSNEDPSRTPCIANGVPKQTTGEELNGKTTNHGKLLATFESNFIYCLIRVVSEKKKKI
jgi:hypothetical protein